MLGAKVAVAGIGLLFSAVLQSTLLSSLVPWVRLDLLLAVAVCSGITSGPLAGAMAGLLGGIVADMLTGRLIGLGMLTRGVSGLLSGFLGQRLFGENVLVPFVIGAIATICDQLLFVAGAKAFGINIPLGQTLARVTVPSTWYNGLLSAFCFPLVYGINRRLTCGE